MIRLLIKLAIAAVIANAAWRVGAAYITHYKFKDAVSEMVQFGGDKTEAQLHARIVQIASDFELPMTEDEVTVRREGEHTLIEGSYQQPLEIFPKVRRPWTFTMHIDVLTVSGGRIPPLK